MTATQLRQWMSRLALTQERAAAELGISRRQLNRYLAGSQPIPKPVDLACQWLALGRKRA